MENTTQTTPAPTPTPWVLEPVDLIIYDGEEATSRAIAIIEKRATEDEREANAAFIVRACNAHDPLLKLAETFAASCSEHISLLRDDLKEDWGDPDDLQDMIGHWTALKNECDNVIRKAYEKAS